MNPDESPFDSPSFENVEAGFAWIDNRIDRKLGDTMTETTSDMARTFTRLRAIAELAFMALASAFLVSLAFSLEASIGVGHHLLLIAAGTILGIGIGRRTT